MNDGAQRVIPSFFGPADVQLEGLAAICRQTADLSAYPQAMAVEQNVVSCSFLQT